MDQNKKELEQKIAAAGSPEELGRILNDAGEKIGPEDTVKLFEKLQNRGMAQEFSADELEAVSGGADRDWAVDDCAATVEQGSWCGSNDKCIHFEVTYEHLPCGDCPYCDGVVYEYSSFEGVYKCKKCGRISGRNAWMVDLP